ncbi:MAG: Amuc_1102 family pilus-like protein [Akkermansiaceae bacterium]
MNSKLQLNSLAVLLFALLAMSLPAMAQQYKLDIDKPEFDDLLSPTIGGGTTAKRFTPKEWLEVEVKLKITSSNRDEDFADKVKVKWYLAVKVTENNSTKVRLIEKEVDYVNVPIDEEVYVSVYLSPTAVKRISGRDNAAKTILEEVGGEITVNGVQPVKGSGFFTTMAKSKGKWWDTLTPYRKIPLLNKNETPFKFFWWDRYAEIEELD